MSVPRDVILDLLPLYVAGEASPATRELIEEYLKGDPELARRVGETRAGAISGLPATTGPRPEIEMESLRRTRRVLAWQRWLLGLGIGLVALCFSTRIEFQGARVAQVRLLIFDLPYVFGPMLLVGVACLVAYQVLKRRQRS